VVTATLDGGFVDVPEWSIDSFTGPNGAVAGASIDENTGEFTWDSAGAPLGAYSAVLRYSHFEAGTDTGVLSFNLIPEPCAMAFCALGMLGVLSLIPRKRPGLKFSGI
jgi:hypothetical protein